MSIKLYYKDVIRITGLQNTGVLCPQLFQFLMNLYGRHRPSNLIVNDSKETIVSEEGTAQGCNLAMYLYVNIHPKGLSPRLQNLMVGRFCSAMYEGHVQ